ncbi:MAG: ImmA/IrrE family metallo-endopeptidase [Myxococcales bacterium]|nr:ImmA/IrrE family metallo-endopeptidase [Myxococcales bacterium]
MATPAVDAMTTAAQVRRVAGLPGDVPLCVYDLVDGCYGHEVDLRFQPLKSLEGMYSRASAGRSSIVVSTERPGGRRRYTCAHELGHHLFGHALSLDELIEEQRSGQRDPREHLCDLFAGFLLMPKLGVALAARERGVDLAAPSVEQVYSLAGYFGVGYAAFLLHASRTLRLVPGSVAESLARISPQRIRRKILGRDTPGELLVVDETWRASRPADLIVGDHILVPRGTQVEHVGLKAVGAVPDGAIYEATSPGLGRADAASWSVFVRVERARYKGMARFRNLEECDDE